MSQCYTTFDLKINLSHSDLYLWSIDFSPFMFCSSASYAVLRQLLSFLKLDFKRFSLATGFAPQIIALNPLYEQIYMNFIIPFQ